MKTPGSRSQEAIARMSLLTSILVGAAMPFFAVLAQDRPALQPVVEVEDEVYQFAPANNGAGPMWCSGSTCVARIGDDVFASGLETLSDWVPLTNCRWMLFQRKSTGWTKVQFDASGRTREPSPLACFPEGELFLSVNPTLGKAPEPQGGPARPAILQFNAKAVEEAFSVLRPDWDGQPEFREHSYRSFAADGPNHELILFQNIGYTHAEWAYRDGSGRWRATGKLKWPWGAEYDQPEPIRVCYPDVALKNGAVHFCGVSDVVEPYRAWRAFKKELTGREWDYDFRRLFYTYTTNISSGTFEPWVEIASRDRTCGWISPGDLWVAPDGAAHIVWTERALDERLRPKFFPNAKQSHSLNYAVVRQGRVVSRRTLLEATEGGPNEIAACPRFQVTPDNRLFVFFYVQGSDSTGKGLSENRLLEIDRDGNPSATVKVPLKHPLGNYFTATVRAGSLPSPILDVLGQRAGTSTSISYGRIRIY